MNMVSSAEAYFSNRYSINNVDYMSRQQKMGIAKSIRKKAAEAWKGVKLDFDPPYAFFLGTAMEMTNKGFYDVDAFLWVAKRFMDGAIDADVIPDDNLDYVTSATVLASKHLVMPPGAEVMHMGLFLPQFMEGVFEVE